MNVLDAQPHHFSQERRVARVVPAGHVAERLRGAVVDGMPGLVDLRGRPDRFGRKLEITQVGAADELAAAASLVMGQADEGYPAVHVRGVPYQRRPGSVRELLRPKSEDLFR